MKSHEDYKEAYTEQGLLDKISKFAKKAGISVIYAILVLYYTMLKADVPMKAKSVIAGALGYFIMPFDIIPDFALTAGYTDDLGVLAVALTVVAMYIDDDIKKKARKKLKEWFGNYDEKALDDIESKITK
jgi:uncharacterized membrane protein YkvA (DUF1232 family)